MSIIIQLGGGKRLGVERYRVNFLIGSDDRKYSSDCIIGCISLDNDRGLRNPVREYRGCSEGILKINECFMGFLGKLEGNGFTSKTSKGNDNFSVVIDESSIEIHKPEERLDVLDSTGFRPILDDLDLCLVHG
jgi:hypothetical protein